MKRKAVRWVFQGWLLLGVASQGGVISVNFNETMGHTAQIIGVEDVAGVWPRAQWNNVFTAAGTATNLLGAIGPAATNYTDTVITWSSKNVWGDGAAQADAEAGVGDAKVARGYLDDGDTNADGFGVEISVANIPYASYSVAVLMSTDADGGVHQPVTINGSVHQTVGQKRQYDNTPQQWNVNTCIVVTNLTGDLTIKVAAGINPDRGCVGGIQIVETSEGDYPPFPTGLGWASDPVEGEDALVGAVYSGTLSGIARDVAGGTLPVTYNKMSGPAWLTIETNGVYSGTPTLSDLGTNVFTVSASDGGDPVEADLQILVKELRWGEGTAIGINFTQGNAFEQIGSTMHAGRDGFIYTNWNNVANATGTRVNLVDSTGQATAAGITWASPRMWQDSTAQAAATAGVGDARLAYSDLEDGYSGESGVNISVSNIPFDLYHVVIYGSTDTEGGLYMPFVVNGVTSAPTTGVKHVYGNHPMYDDSNSIVVSNVTGDLSIVGFNRYDYMTANDRGTVGGIQLVNAMIIPADPVEIGVAGMLSDGSGLVLAWPTQTGYGYTVETNGDLVAGSWGVFLSGLVGDGDTMVVTNAFGAQGVLFYRVVAE